MGILKAKNMLIIIAIGYTIIAIISLMSELSHIRSVTAEVRDTMTVASESALSQVVASDEFFNDKSGDNGQQGVNALYATKGVTTVLVDKGLSGDTVARYTPENIFSLVYGLNDNVTSANDVAAEKMKLYHSIYYSDLGAKGTMLNNSGWLQAVFKINFDFMGHKVPQLSRIGLLHGYKLSGDSLVRDMSVPDGELVLSFSSATLLFKQLQDSGMRFTPKYDSSKQGFYAWDSDWLGLTKLKKDTYKDGPTYFLAPTNVGITYIDPVLLQTAFACDMSLLMHGVGLKGQLGDTRTIPAEIAYGVPSQGFEGKAQVVTQECEATISQHNIITNGSFSYVKGAYVTPPGSNSNGDPSLWGGFTGGSVKQVESGTASATASRVYPRVRYRVINMSDAKYMPLMSAAIGVDYSSDTIQSYNDWLTAIGVEQDSGGNFKEKYCVVAEVTFYADVIIPYKSKIAREYYSMYTRANGDTSKCFFQVPNIADGADVTGLVSEITGNQLYEYTTYYAMIP